MTATPIGCGTCEGFGYLDYEDETECPTCGGRGVADVCDDPLCCVQDAPVREPSRTERGSHPPLLTSSAPSEPGPS
jgi:hypothetical protein